MPCVDHVQPMSCDRKMRIQKLGFLIVRRTGWRPGSGTPKLCSSVPSTMTSSPRFRPRERVDNMPARTDTMSAVSVAADIGRTGAYLLYWVHQPRTVVDSWLTNVICEGGETTSMVQRRRRRTRVWTPCYRKEFIGTPSKEPCTHRTYMGASP